jgi:hypothetical protein
MPSEMRKRVRNVSYYQEGEVEVPGATTGKCTVVMWRKTLLFCQGHVAYVTHGKSMPVPKQMYGGF